MFNFFRNSKILDDELRCWGIDSANNISHQHFKDSKKSELIKIKNGNYEPIAPDMPVLLPDVIDDAVEQVITDEIKYVLMKYEDIGFWVCHDQLKKDYPDADIPPWAPFEYNKYTKSYDIIPQLGEMGVTREDLDPLLRFSFVHENCRDKLWSEYVTDKNAKYSYLRAIVFFHACHHAKCAACGRKSVQYNALYEAAETRSWNRMVCVECGSIYEVKISSDYNNMMRRLRNNHRGIAGGAALDKYYAIKSSLPSKAKFYLVLTPMKFWENQKVRDVFVVEIDYIIPQLRDKSFEHEDSGIKNPFKIYSKIFPKVETSRKWFDMPIDDKDCTDIAKQALTSL